MYTNWPNSNLGKGGMKTTLGSGFNDIAARSTTTFVCLQLCTSTPSWSNKRCFSYGALARSISGMRLNMWKCDLYQIYNNLSLSFLKFHLILKCGELFCCIQEVSNFWFLFIMNCTILFLHLKTGGLGGGWGYPRLPLIRPWLLRCVGNIEYFFIDLTPNG